MQQNHHNRVNVQCISTVMVVLLHHIGLMASVAWDDH